MKERGIRLLFNSNSTLLAPWWQGELVTGGLDGFRCSIDRAIAEAYARIRGADTLHKIKERLSRLNNKKGPCQRRGLFGHKKTPGVWKPLGSA